MSGLKFTGKVFNNSNLAFNQRMKVLKFGGTSVGSVENMRAVMDIIIDGERKIVVLSAMSGTTNSLVEISEYLYKKNKKEAEKAIGKLEEKYVKVVADLFVSAEMKEKGAKLIDKRFAEIKSFINIDFNAIGEQAILAQGELISTALFTYLLQENGHKAALIPALDFMKINEYKNPDEDFIAEAVKPFMSANEEAEIIVTQGFICRNPEGNIDNLQRGGSDYTATLIGAAIDADEIEIWTDIDGFHNNDPRFVENTSKIEQLSFDEAAELAYFGAKILHPSTVLPCRKKKIPVRLKNTMNPTDSGTIIASESSGIGIKAVAAKDNITAIKIRSSRMLMAYGFLRKVFEIFETYKTPVDLIATSEVAVSVTIDNTSRLQEIVTDLKELGEVDVDTDMTIVSVVGHMLVKEGGAERRVLEALDGIPVRMISFGGSNHNISILIGRDDKTKALRGLSDKLFA